MRGSLKIDYGLQQVYLTLFMQMTLTDINNSILNKQIIHFDNVCNYPYCSIPGCGLKID